MNSKQICYSSYQTIELTYINIIQSTITSSNYCRSDIRKEKQYMRPENYAAKVKAKAWLWFD